MCSCICQIGPLGSTWHIRPQNIIYCCVRQPSRRLANKMLPNQCVDNSSPSKIGPADNQKAAAIHLVNWICICIEVLVQLQRLPQAPFIGVESPESTRIRTHIARSEIRES